MKNLNNPKYRKFLQEIANMVAQDEHGNLYAVGPNKDQIRFVENESGYQHIHRINEEMDIFWKAHEFVVENIGYVTTGLNSKMQKPRRLKKNEEVHHVDGNPKNNRPENLIIMHKKMHHKYHQRVDCYAAYIYKIPEEEFFQGNQGVKRLSKKVIEKYAAEDHAKKIRAFMDEQNAPKFLAETQERRVTLEIYKAAFDANEAYKCYKKSLDKLNKLKKLKEKK